MEIATGLRGRRVRRFFRPLALVAAALFAVGCSAGHEEPDSRAQFVGKWIGPTGLERIQFFADGRFIVEGLGTPSAGTYEIVQEGQAKYLKLDFKSESQMYEIVRISDRLIELKGDGTPRQLWRIPTACFLEMHGERSLDSTERIGYSKVKKEFEKKNYETKAVTLMQKMQIPSDCSMVIVAGPKTDYPPQEVGAIRRYVAEGGRAMFMLDPGVDLPELSKLLAGWNVTVRNDLVIDQNPIAKLFGTEPTMPLIVKYGSSPIVQPVGRNASLFPFTRSFSVGKDYKGRVTTESVCETSDASFGVADFNPNMHQVSFRAGMDIKGPLTVAVSGTLSREGENKAEGRFIALGTSLLPANAFLEFQANRALFMNMVNWLSADEGLNSNRATPP